LYAYLDMDNVSNTNEIHMQSYDVDKVKFNSDDDENSLVLSYSSISDVKTYNSGIYIIILML